MKKIFTPFFVILALASVIAAQDKTEPRIIEVSGSAERWITPDVFTFKITLLEGSKISRR